MNQQPEVWSVQCTKCRSTGYDWDGDPCEYCGQSGVILIHEEQPVISEGLTHLLTICFFLALAIAGCLWLTGKL
jgi:hypothetical protein